MDREFGNGRTSRTMAPAGPIDLINPYRLRVDQSGLCGAPPLTSPAAGGTRRDSQLFGWARPRRHRHQRGEPANRLNTAGREPAQDQSADAGADADPAAPPVRVTTGEEEIQPPPGRSAGEVAEYAIDTERVRARPPSDDVAQSEPVMQPLLTPPPRKQWPPMVCALVLVGGVGLNLSGEQQRASRWSQDRAGRRQRNASRPKWCSGGASLSSQVPEDTFVATLIIPVKPG